MHVCVCACGRVCVLDLLLARVQACMCVCVHMGVYVYSTCSLRGCRHAATVRYCSRKRPMRAKTSMTLCRYAYVCMQVYMHMCVYVHLRAQTSMTLGVLTWRVEKGGR